MIFLKSMGLTLSILFFSILQSIAAAEDSSWSSNLDSGDFIFLDLDCGEICDAIENVTLEQFRVEGPRLSHVGLIDRDSNGKLFVIEAWPVVGVQRLELSVFLSRVKGAENELGGFYIGRVQPAFRVQAIEALNITKAEIGKPYDNIFNMGADSFYCSELVWFGWKNLLKGFFSLEPMFFGNPGSKDYEVWRAYYEKEKLPVPAGDPGLSPLGIYLSAKKTIFIDESY